MMAAMDISSRVEFAAPVETVFAMMTDQAYLEEVCKASAPLNYEATVTGTTTRTSRTAAGPGVGGEASPGRSSTVVEEIAWGPADADGIRTGRVDLTIPGQPVTMRGTVQLAAGGPGTVADLTGELKVAIPMLGKKLEQSSRPGGAGRLPDPAEGRQRLAGPI